MPRKQPPRATLTVVILGIILVAGPVAVFAQKPPAGAGIPIPTISIGSDGIKLNAPRAPGGPGMGPRGSGGPEASPSAPTTPRPSDEAEMEAFRRALAAQATPGQVS